MAWSAFNKHVYTFSFDYVNKGQSSLIRRLTYNEDGAFSNPY